MADVIVEKKSLKDAADAIRSKTGKNGLITQEDFAGEIESIGGGASLEGTYYSSIAYRGDFQDEVNLSVPGVVSGTVTKYSVLFLMDTQGLPLIRGNKTPRYYIPTGRFCGNAGKDITALWQATDTNTAWGGLYKNLFYYPANAAVSYEINGVESSVNLGNTTGFYMACGVNEVIANSVKIVNGMAYSGYITNQDTSSKWRTLTSLLGGNTPVVYQNSVFCKLPLVGYNTMVTPGSGTSRGFAYNLDYGVGQEFYKTTATTSSGIWASPELRAYKFTKAVSFGGVDFAANECGIGFGFKNASILNVEAIKSYFNGLVVPYSITSMNNTYQTGVDTAVVKIESDVREALINNGGVASLKIPGAYAWTLYANRNLGAALSDGVLRNAKNIALARSWNDPETGEQKFSSANGVVLWNPEESDEPESSYYQQDNY